MFKKGNNIFSLLVIILSIFMTSTSNIVNADSTSLGTSTPQTTATTSTDSGTTGTENTNGTADAEGNTDTKSTDSSTSKTEDLTNQSSTTDWGNQLITKAQLQDENGTPQDSFGQYDTIKAYWEFSTNNHVVHDGDTMHVTVPKELTIANDILTPQPVTEIPGGKEIGTATLIKSTRTITVTFNQYAANKSKTSTVVGSFNAITHWDLGQVSVNQKVPLNWNLQGSATNDTDYTPSATVSKPSVTDPDEKLFKYGSYIDDTIQWTVRLNYASQEISDAVYKDTLGKNQELLIDSSHPFTVNSATADHTTGKITNDTDNLFAETQPSDITNTGFTVDLGTINKPVIITYYTRITNYKNISSSYGNTGDLLSNKNEVQNLPVNISSTTLGSDASSGDQITSFMGHKIWKNVPADQIPKSITVNLIQNDNTTYASQKVTADSDWSYVFNNLPKYDDNGNLYKYSVTEDPVDGFTSSTSGNDLINVLTSSKTQFTVTKKWIDGKTQDDHDPIEVGVYDGKGNRPSNYQKNVVLSPGHWTYTFTDLDPSITWYVSEHNIPAGYISEDSYPTEDSYNKVVTNTLATTFKVTKKWVDGDNTQHPNKIDVQLYSSIDGKNKTAVGDPVELNKENSWSHTFGDGQTNQTKLPKYDKNNKKITYSAEEVKVPDNYTQESSTNINDTEETITNTYKSTTPETTQVNVNKVWKDNKLTHSPITVHLIANDKDTGKTVKLSENNWSGSFTNLDKQSNGKDIKYSVSEDPLTGYTSKVTNPEGTNDFTITNTPTQTTPTTRSFTVKKVWADGKTNHNAIEVYLTKNGTKTGEPIPLNEKNGWSYTWNDLAINDGDKAIEYSATEDPVPDGYIANTDTTNDGVQITNTVKPTTDEKTSLTVTKSWNDEKDKDGIRPDSVKVNLLADNKDTGKSITLNEGNNWTDEFKNLDKKVNDKDVIYTVQENKVADYDASYDYSKTSNLVKITNKHTPKSVTPSNNKRTFTVVKKWADNNNSGNTRPSEIKVQLTANGENVGDPVTLNAKGGWTKTWSDLDKQENGKDIKYSVNEVNVKGYTTNVTDTNDGSTITNTLIPVTPVDSKTELTVTKSWNDENNKDGIRPDSVEVNLLADGKDTGKTITLNKDNSWTDTFKNLDKKVNDKVVHYTVEENDVSGYKVSPDPIYTDTTHVTIINKHTPKSVTPSDNKRTFTVIKKWDDNNNVDSTRPSEIKVQLTANGKNVGDPVTLNAKSGWTNTWSNLDKQENGKDIKYSVKEIKVSGYTTKIVTKDGLATIINTLNHVTPPVDNKTKLTVTKTWNDKNNQDQLRPNQVKVQLLADGKNTGDPVVLNADNDWSYTWNNLDKNVKYSVKETPVTGYTTEVKPVDDNNISIINTHSTNTPVNPGKPGNPDKPTTPINPTIPTTPTEPEQPTEPSNPSTSTDTDLIPSESNNNESTSTDSTPLLPDNPLTPAKASDPNTSNEDVTKGLLPQTGNQTTWILSLLGLIVLIGLGFYELIKKLA